MARVSKGTQLKVGLFVLFILFIFAVGLFTVGSHKKYFQRQYTLWAKFGDIQGLIVGAPVRLAGVTVGRVSAIHFPQRIGEKKVIVELRINEGVRERIREDSVAAIRTMGLLGDKYVEVSMGSPGSRVLKDQDEIKSSEPLDIYQYLSKTERALNAINSILTDVKDVSHEIREGRGFIHSLIYDPEGGKLIRTISEGSKKIVDNLKDITHQAREGKGLIHSLLYDPEGRRLIHNLAKASESLDKVMKDVAETSHSLKEIVQRVERGEGTLGALINDPSVYEDLRVILGGAKRSKTIRSFIRYTIKKGRKREGE